MECPVTIPTSFQDGLYRGYREYHVVSYVQGQNKPGAVRELEIVLDLMFA
jgi:hypothetical protein